MPHPSAATVPTASRTHAAIARAAERTGADFSYLLAQARLESSLDPQAHARTSSAAGLYQFIDSTWLQTLDRHGAEFGMGAASQAIDTVGGRARISDPAMRSPIMALRFDPEASALMAGALAEDNRAALAPVLGRDPDASELYLAHFLGAAGAGRFLSALQADPSAPASGLLPAAAAANRAIFYQPGGAPRSLAGVMDLVRGKMAAAMELGGSAPAGLAAGPAQGFAAARAGWASLSNGGLAPSAPTASASARPSMSETLRTSFALADTPRASGSASHVRHAYGKLRALGL
jgi:hypothetical protein